MHKQTRCTKDCLSLCGRGRVTVNSKSMKPVDINMLKPLHEREERRKNGLISKWASFYIYVCVCVFVCRQKMAFCTADVITWDIGERARASGQLHYNFPPLPWSYSLPSNSFQRQLPMGLLPRHWLSNSYGWAVMSWGGWDGVDGRGELQAASYTTTTVPLEDEPKHTFQRRSHWRGLPLFSYVSESKETSWGDCH